MPSERQPSEPDVRQRGKQGCVILAAGCALALMVCVLGGLVVQWRGGELPELSGQVGAYRIVAYTTVAPTCAPTVPCTQRFADVPLPRYYVIWVISQSAPKEAGTRVLTIPLTLALAPK
jgi:hypothetical protein